MLFITGQLGGGDLVSGDSQEEGAEVGGLVEGEGEDQIDGAGGGPPPPPAGPHNGYMNDDETDDWDQHILDGLQEEFCGLLYL